jgi:hypothetical protein
MEIFNKHPLKSVKNVKYDLKREISGSKGGEYENDSLLGNRAL